MAVPVGANFAVNPVNGNDVVISSTAGRIFPTTNQGSTGSSSAIRRSSAAPAASASPWPSVLPTPTPPRASATWATSSTPAPATARSTSPRRRRRGASNNWINISAGSTARPSSQIITDPTRGSHDAYAVTSTGVYYIANSVPWPKPDRPTVGQYHRDNIHNLAYRLFGQTYNPTTDPNSKTYNQAMGLTAIVADWRYQIPNSPANPSLGYHPVLYVAGNSGVYQSLDQGQTWSLFPSTTFGGLRAGGYLPHVSVSSLSLSLGNINPTRACPTRPARITRRTPPGGHSATPTS